MLDLLFQKEELDLFLDKHFTRIPFSKHLDKNVYHHLINWEKIEKILTTLKSHLRIVKEGQMVKDYAPLQFKGAIQYYETGHSLVIKNAELSAEEYLRIATSFSNYFHTEVDIQLYCTPAKFNAFGWHYDVEEVFIIQVSGSKEYTIRQNTIHPNPLVGSIPKNMGFENEKSDLVLKVLLKEGDLLYIPSGWWHKAETQSESLHMSIGLMPRSAVDLVSFLPQFLTHSAYWRSRLPVHKTFSNSEEETIFFQQACEKLGEDLRNQFQKPEFIHQFFEFIKARSHGP